MKTNSREETQKVASEFAKNFEQEGGLILLTGNLGAGKTTFTQGFIKSFGITNNITSPTFLLVKQYNIPNQDRLIFHLDLYRLAEPINLKETGIQEMLDSSKDNIIIIEWSEKIIKELKSREYYQVSLEKKANDERSITITKNNI